jgi:hypothetical protein
MSHAPSDQVVLEEPDRVILNTLLGGPGGRPAFQGDTSVQAFVGEFRRRCLEQESLALGLTPPGMVVRTVHHRNGVIVFLVEVAPGQRTMQWLQDDSPADFGSRATYHDVEIALPWQYFFIAMTPAGHLWQRSSVYFLTTPLRALDEPLLEPHFFNCSVEAYGVYCWVCTQHFRREEKRKESHAAFAFAFIDQFFYGGFNASSEVHEGASFWGRNRKRILDRRVRTTTAWEAASKNDPDFALSVPWMQAPRTAADVLREITEIETPWPPTTTTDIAGIVTTCMKRKGRSA